VVRSRPARPKTQARCRGRAPPPGERAAALLVCCLLLPPQPGIYAPLGPACYYPSTAPPSFCLGPRLVNAVSLCKQSNFLFLWY
jgi:hypothetical protein